MKILFIFLTILLSQSAFAHSPAHLKDFEIVRENLDFVESRDPGYMELRDVYGQFSAWYFNDLIEFEDINTWVPDEKIDVVSNEKKGYGIVRHKNQMFYKVIFSDEYDPIKTKQQECLKTADTTGAMVSCYKTSALEWRTEYLFAYHHLQKTLPKDIAKMVEDTEKDLMTLSDSYFKTYKNYLDHLGGSIRYISWARVDADFQEMRYDAILNFCF